MFDSNSIDDRALKARGMMKQRAGDLFSVRLAVTGGHVTARDLEAIASLAQRFGAGAVHLTTRQGIEIPNVPHANLEPLAAAIAEAGLSLGATGPRVRGITACPGDICQHGLIDTQALARRLASAVGGRSGLPHKFKIAVTGCPNGCAKPIENDLGVMGVSKGYRIFVGGRMGRAARLGDRLPLILPDETSLMRVIEAAIDWYCQNAEGRERFGSTIDRVGLDSLMKRLELAAA